MASGINYFRIKLNYEALDFPPPSRLTILINCSNQLYLTIYRLDRYHAAWNVGA